MGERGPAVTPSPHPQDAAPHDPPLSSPPGDPPRQTQVVPPTGPLTGPELVALQLVARGYPLGQIAPLVGARDAGGVVALLRRAAEALGSWDAVGEARRRRLIV
jgi:hypothetical protein